MHTCLVSTSGQSVLEERGPLMRPHRARMSDDTLEMLVLLACNSGIWSRQWL